MPKTSCPLCRCSSVIANQVDQYKYYRCVPCNLLFLYPQPSKTQIDKYYKSSFDYFAGKTNETPIRARAKKILLNLKSINPSGTSLLDVGSGYGYFANEALDIGLNVSAVEPSGSFYNVPIYKSIKKLYKTSFEIYAKSHQNIKYDFITFIHVIEHVSNPKKLMKDACKLLSPDGILYIETPNLDSHLYKAEQNNYTFLTPPDHLWIFSKKTIKTITPPRCQIDKVSTYSYPEHLMGIIKAIFKSGNSHAYRTVVPVQFQPTRLELGHSGRPDEAKKVSYSSLRLIKYLLFDRCIAPLFYRLLNLHYHGSILELYIKKK
ncbi:hypothetical protein COY90_01905 [Candidatus Roizmanbacteria bacterium CG_4_10_14_0_8_um_filter_39_9]|uniref:Class I SAM-dependent methyltransferase n=1 Tax=Candidatus Roizmanbacteria bacterium CG_4_10_14_0_8_um_filter_39_9 TaxID=1974829 RepID=A0A2M7QDB0_9BACT|nr:MAG: hypothetical protein COY90_01905 [Candidatus Roizmanbacteria bacterium CG_4_10_14_0_8_um_filter_39_9]